MVVGDVGWWGVVGGGWWWVVGDGVWGMVGGGGWWSVVVGNPRDPSYGNSAKQRLPK